MSTASPSGPRPVVAGVDGSDASVVAAVYAAEEARRRGLPLLLVHATPWNLSGTLTPVPAADFGRLLEDSAADLLRTVEAEVLERAGTLPSVGTRVVDDYPVPGLCHVSADAALLVLGRRGVRGVTGMLAGSTASGVVQHAQCPVVVLPEDADLRTGEPGPIVVGVEGAPEDEQVLAFAVAEAAERGTHLVAVHAWREIALEVSAGRVPPLVDWSGVAQEEEALLAETVAGWRDKEPDVDIREVVVRDRAAAALREAATDAQLLVVGHRHRPVLARLGSTVHGLLHRAPCPLAVVPLLRAEA
jgi:nucleotide-binding universal stress UspA family protein